MRTPSLIEAASDSSRPPDGLQLVSASSGAPDRRRLSLSDGKNSTVLDYSIPNPEIAQSHGQAQLAADGVWVLDLPLEDSSWQEVEKARPELVILGNARKLWAAGEPFVESVRELRARLGSRPLLWGPRLALPQRVALLAYLGFDLLDDTEALFQAAQGSIFSSTLGKVSSDLPVPGCSCPRCSSENRGDLEIHAQWTMRHEISYVRGVVGQGRLRELVEARLVGEAALAEMLRYTDRILGSALEERTPVTSTEVHDYVLKESFRRPEVVRFRRRFLERYRPPPGKSVLLLVPCSKTKPYRLSRSHRKFARAWIDLPGRDRIHVVSVTSPLGLVPRELEDVPPARHYEIPVTGEWDESERTGVLVALRHLLESGAYSRRVVHLGASEYSFLLPALSPSDSTVWTVHDENPTSRGSLEELNRTLSSAVVELGPSPGGPLARVREELRTIASWQFGAHAAEQLFASPTRLQGRPWFQRLTDGGGTDLATWREERGLFHLTVPGAMRLPPDTGLFVDVAPSFELTGDLFCPGVLRADPTIRAGDTIVVRRDGNVAGVGEAAASGRMMSELGHGLAVRIRHRMH